MIHISIATSDDITYFGDDVNIYPALLSRVIIIWGLVRKDNFLRPYFCQIFES